MNYMEQVSHMLGVELEEEFNVYKSKIVNKFTEDGIVSYSKDNQNWIRNYYLLENLLIGYTEIIKKPILDDIEKEYLSNVIKPFRDKVQDITKVDLNHAGVYEFIRINHDDYGSPIGTINLPNFRNGDMYKGMEVDKEYTLEELGL